MNGNVRWTIATQSPVYGSAAISNGIAFINIDNAIKAISVASGQVLWSYPLSGSGEASPIVVPSGVYTTDVSGNVYKFAL